MKPDWKDAPEWAQWLAMDEDGEWCWFDYRPFAEDQWCKWEVSIGRYAIADHHNNQVNSNWRETLESRPEES